MACGGAHISCDRRTSSGEGEVRLRTRWDVAEGRVTYLVDDASDKTREVLWVLRVGTHHHRHTCRSEEQIAARHKWDP